MTTWIDVEAYVAANANNGRRAPIPRLHGKFLSTTWRLNPAGRQEGRRCLRDRYWALITDDADEALSILQSVPNC